MRAQTIKRKIKKCPQMSSSKRKKQKKVKKKKRRKEGNKVARKG